MAQNIGALRYVGEAHAAPESAISRHAGYPCGPSKRLWVSLLPLLWTKAEVLCDEMCALRSGAGPSIDFEVYWWLLDAGFVVAKAAEDGNVGQLMKRPTVIGAYTSLLLVRVDDKPDERDTSAMRLDRRPHSVREAGMHGRFRSESEGQGAINSRRVREDLYPELLSQAYERLAAEGEHGGQRINDEVVVEDRVAEQFL